MVTDPFARQRREGHASGHYLLSDAVQMVTSAVIDCDQTVHGPYGEHVPR